MKTRLALATVVAALACAAPAAANPPQDYFPNACGQPVTGTWFSPATNHAWRGEHVWFVPDVPRGEPTDGVLRLYAAEVNDGWGFRVVYLFWISCYY